jgi:hypothetical protein
VFITRCWVTGSGPMRCLDDDVVRDATIEQMSQAVFSAGPPGALGDYISEPTKLNAVRIECQCA